MEFHHVYIEWDSDRRGLKDAVESVLKDCPRPPLQAAHAAIDAAFSTKRPEDEGGVETLDVLEGYVVPVLIAAGIQAGCIDSPNIEGYELAVWF